MSPAPEADEEERDDDVAVKLSWPADDLRDRPATVVRPARRSRRSAPPPAEPASGNPVERLEATSAAVADIVNELVRERAPLLSSVRLAVDEAAGPTIDALRRSIEALQGAVERLAEGAERSVDALSTLAPLVDDLRSAVQTAARHSQGDDLAREIADKVGTAVGRAATPAEPARRPAKRPAAKKATTGGRRTRQT